jgi:hypothetical protein
MTMKMTANEGSYNYYSSKNVFTYFNLIGCYTHLMEIGHC